MYSMSMYVWKSTESLKAARHINVCVLPVENHERAMENQAKHTAMETVGADNLSVVDEPQKFCRSD